MDVYVVVHRGRNGGYNTSCCHCQIHLLPLLQGSRRVLQAAVAAQHIALNKAPAMRCVPHNTAPADTAVVRFTTECIALIGKPLKTPEQPQTGHCDDKAGLCRCNL